MEQQETASINNIQPADVLKPKKKFRKHPLTTISLRESTKLRFIALRIHPSFKPFRGSWDNFVNGIVDYFKDSYKLTLKIEGQEVK